MTFSVVSLENRDNRDKIIHRLALDIWDKLQKVRGELEPLVKKLDRSSNPDLALDAKVALEHLTEARKLVALLTEQDFNVKNGD